MAELRELEEHREELSQHVRILPISVDRPEDQEKARSLIDRLEVGYEWGFASGDLLEILEALQRVQIDKRRPIALPTSFLIDGQNRLAAIYRGPVTPGIILDHANKLPLSGDALRDAATPFPGRWLAPAPSPPLDRLARDFLFYERPEIAAFFISGERERMVAKYGGVARTDYELRGNIYRTTADLRRAEGKSAEALELYESAIRAYDTELERKPGNSEVANNLGVVYSKLDRYEEAIAAYERALPTHPVPSTVHLNLYRIYDHLGDRDKADHHLQEAIRLDPRNMELRMMLAFHRIQEGQIEEAAEIFREMIDLDPRQVPARQRLAEYHLRRQEFDQAETLFREALRIEPNHVHCRIGLARTLTQRRQFPQAIAEYEAALKVDPNDSNGLRELANLYHRAGRTDDAIRLLQAAVERRPRDLRVLTHLALLHDAAGDREEALEVYERCRQLNPRVAEKLLERLNRKPGQ